VEDRIKDIFATYGGASLWSLVIDAGELVALAIVAYEAKLYKRTRLERPIVGGEI